MKRRGRPGAGARGYYATPAELRAAVVSQAARGWSVNRMARAAGCSDRTVRGILENDMLSVSVERKETNG